MAFQVIEDLDLADKLAEAGLLWYSYPGYSPLEPRAWSKSDWMPTRMQRTYSDYTFYILLED